MKTVTVKCDLCFNIMASHDVTTGIKWLAQYEKYELNVQGIRSEFCSMSCMEKYLNSGESQPSQPQEIVDMGIPLNPTSSLPPGSLIVQ